MCFANPWVYPTKVSHLRQHMKAAVSDSDEKTLLLFPDIDWVSRLAGAGLNIWDLAPVCSASSERWGDFYLHTLWLSHTHIHALTVTEHIKTVSSRFLQLVYLIYDVSLSDKRCLLCTVSLCCAIPSCISAWMLTFIIIPIFRSRTAVVWIWAYI